jgi:hypothetical protein
MAVLVVSTFEVSGLTIPALAVVKAAVLYAKKNQDVPRHTMSVGKFCELASLPSMTMQCFRGLLTEACGALAIVEVVDTCEPDRDDLPYSSCPVLEGVSIDGCDVTFGVDNSSFDEGLSANLQGLQPSMRHEKWKGDAFMRQLCNELVDCSRLTADG